MATAQQAVVRGTDSDQSPRGKQQAAGQMAGAVEQSRVVDEQESFTGGSRAEQSRGRAGVVTGAVEQSRVVSKQRSVPED